MNKSRIERIQQKKEAREKLRHQLDINDHVEDVNVPYLVINRAQHEKDVQSLNKGQRQIYDEVIDTVERQTREPVIRTRPDNIAYVEEEVPPKRIFITGDGMEFI